MLAFFSSSAQVDLLDIVALCAGLGVFLMGMKLMSDSMEKFANNKLRSLLNSVTNNKLKGVGVGAAVTAIIQSSSATTVMTVGLVNAGVLTLVQSVPIIMGANIGTTITAQIAALQSFNVTDYITLLVVIGAFMALLCKKDKTKTIGIILAGLGLLFVGLDIMSGAMVDMRDSTFFRETIQTITNPLLLVLIGVVFTGIIQSSSAVTGILVSMAASGIVIGGGGNAVLYVILGTNIGTCVTAMLSSIGANTNGKRAAVIHLMFNVIGTLVFMIMLLCWPSFYDVTLAVWFEGVPSTQIAMFHTFFNVVTTLLLLPFSNVLVRLSKLIVKSKGGDNDCIVCKYIDNRFLEMPSIAISQAEKEVGNAISVAQNALDIAIDAFVNRNNSKLDEVQTLRSHLRLCNAAITKYLIEVSSKQISYDDEKTLGALHHILTDIDRLSELAENIRRYSQVSQDSGLEFSAAVMQEVSDMHAKLTQQFAAVLTSVENWNGDLLPQIEEREDQVDECKKSMLDSHIKRLNDGECKIESSSVFINLVGNLERVGDHLAKIARSVAQ